MTKRRWEAATNRTQAELLKLNRELKTWPEACEVVSGAKEYAGNAEFLAQVAEQLTDSTLTRLESTYRLIQWDRIRSGDLVFPGRGFVVYDDVFTVAGRANWILRTVTETSFGYVKPDSTAEQPTDPANPAALCNPDVTARIFLRQVTDVQGELSAAEWAAWWTEHRDRLSWNPATARFEGGAAPAPAPAGTR